MNQIWNTNVYWKKTAAKVAASIQHYYQANFRAPHLLIIQVGLNDASKYYLKHKIKICEASGVNVKIHYFQKEDDPLTCIQQIKAANQNDQVDGIIVQLPLPKSWPIKKILNTVDPSKDVDGLTSYHQGRMMIGLPTLLPATVQGVMKLFNRRHINLQGKIATIIGQSKLLGQPLANALINCGATVLSCNIHTPNLKKITIQADILITATGSKHLITANMVKKNVLIIDIGTHYNENQVYGDVEPSPALLAKVRGITPVPGGVGLLTQAELLLNLLHLYEYHLGKVNLYCF